ncbi:MAG: tryptophan synthase subunit alpha [Actinomycetota bacterium]
MNLESHLRARRDAGAKALVAYVTGGLSADWPDVVRAVVAAGADAVEIGIPFSDPIMDGPTIQAASQRSLARGTTPVSVIEETSRLDVDVPLLVMTYCNIIERLGSHRAAELLRDAGVDGSIIADLPLDEAGPWGEVAAAAGIENVLLAAPSTPDDRLAEICERSRGFVYGVALMGVTGERAALAEDAGAIARRCRACTDRPVLLGVGISNPEQAVAAAADADGVVVGSALLRRLLDGGGPDEAAAFIGSLRAALDEE